MNKFYTLSVLTASLLMAVGKSAVAQSTFSMPNPLLKPATFAADKNGAVGAQQRPSVPQSAPAPQVPPLPPAVSQASLPGQSGSRDAPTNETVIRDTLATFTVTAIVGDRAVLRNNVGAITMTAETATAAAAAAAARGTPNLQSTTGAAQAPLTRQAVIRVKSAISVFVSGVELTPTVLDSRVEFRIAGRKPVVATVTLESQSSYGYVPVSREVADPAVQTRVNPLTSGDGSGRNAGNGVGGNKSSTPSNTNGQVLPQR